MVRIVRSIQSMKAFSESCRADGRSVGLVPTMGYLHDGHMSLVRASREENDVTVVSIFVNPIQFGPGEDLDRYPRDEARDLTLLEAGRVDCLFAPPREEMFPSDHSVTVDESSISLPMCGASRPGHFQGVCTVVLKLVNVVRPYRAYFGMKDYQQLQVVRRMVRDLNVPVEIRPCPLLREADGLAWSSRNAYLSPEERRSALSLSQALFKAQKAFEAGERSARVLVDSCLAVLAQEASLRPEYVELRDALDLSPVEQIDSPVVLAMAVRVGTTRLIDNIVLG